MMKTLSIVCVVLALCSLIAAELDMHSNFVRANGAMAKANGKELLKNLEKSSTVKRDFFSSLDPWRCVGKPGYCLPFCSGLCNTLCPDTLHVWMIEQFANLLMTRDYYSIVPMLDVDVTYNVVGLIELGPEPGIATGIDIVVGYFLLGDPSISDTFEWVSLNSMDFIEQGNKISVKVNQTLRSLQMDPPDDVFEQNFIWIFEFNDKNQIIHITQQVDTALQQRKFPYFGNPNITELCNTIQTACTGAVEQYSSFQVCVDFMDSIPLTTSSGTLPSGQNTVGCRAFHAKLALAEPAVHCHHVGPDQMGPPIDRKSVV